MDALGLSGLTGSPILFVLLAFVGVFFLALFANIVRIRRRSPRPDAKPARITLDEWLDTRARDVERDHKPPRRGA